MIYGRNKDQAQAHYYLGRYYHNIKDLKNAMFHLQKALDLTGDPERKKDIKDLMSSTGKNTRHNIREGAENIRNPANFYFF